MDHKIPEREWLSIPILPCLDIEDTLRFWESLGFTRTYCMKSPYQYGIVARGGYSLHFSRVKGLSPKETYSSCLVMVSNIDKVYRSFAEGFKRNLGKVPQQGLPRISRRQQRQTRFTVTDPGGNSVIFIEYGPQDETLYDEADREGLSPLQKAVALSFKLYHYKEDEPAALKVLDNGLAKAKEEPPLTLAHALLSRINMARGSNDRHKEEECLARLRNIVLTSEELVLLKEKTGIPDHTETILATLKP